jgi:hypothetical protein
MLSPMVVSLKSPTKAPIIVSPTHESGAHQSCGRQLGDKHEPRWSISGDKTSVLGGRRRKNRVSKEISLESVSERRTLSDGFVVRYKG